MTARPPIRILETGVFSMDKRRFTRTDFETGGVIHAGERRIPFTLVDVSLKGMLVSPEQPDALSLGDPADIEIVLAGGEVTIEASARCVHREGDYLGFRFEIIDAQSMMHLRRLLELNTGRAETIGRELSFLADT
ncbi:MAG: PilZ domain-containing protein [Spirochaetaceae bacterium]